VQILGAGAIGSIFGYFLLMAGCDVVFVARGKRYRELKNGLKISGMVDYFEKVEVSDVPVKSWLTIVAVKSYDTEKAVRGIGNLTDVVMSIQNGIGNEDIIAKEAEKVIGATTSYAANLRDGVVFYAGEGETWIGNWKGCGEEVFEVAEILAKGGMNVRITENIAEMKWIKAAINAVINPLTAIAGVKNGELLRREFWNVAKFVCMECELLLRNMGIFINLEQKVKTIAKKTANNKSSMLQDLERGKKTEIDAITGKILEEAKKARIETKANEIMYWMVKALETSASKKSKRLKD
jgi:2-dehydropantoate 2-reductase